MDLSISRKQMNEILFRALRAVYRFERIKVEIFGLTFEYIYLMQYLRRRSSARMGEIAEEMRIPISTVSRIIDRLQSENLVSRKQDIGDKRGMLVSLEPEGLELVKKVEKHTFETLSRNLTVFEETDLAAFIKTAGLLDQILVASPENHPGNSKKE